MTSPSRPRYHHGNLARAMVEVAVGLAEAGGPSAVVLREVARRTGVTPAAAYRHFSGHEALLAAVAQQALDGMAEDMLEQQGRLPAQADERQRARLRWRATGESYVHYAIGHPGLFRTAFTTVPRAAPPASTEASATRASDATPNPYVLLTDALDDCVAVGLISSEARLGADQLSWIAVHGLSVLAIDGHLPATGPDFDRLLRSTLDVFEGLLIDTPTARSARAG